MTVENPQMACSQVQARVAELFGIPSHMMLKIKTQSNNLRENQTFSTPGKSRTQSMTKVNIDNLQKCALRNIAHNFHKKTCRNADVKKVICCFENR